jgi:tetratricopeptide (TPR) repeat protein
MASASTTLQQAIQHHRTGNLRLAEQLYMEVLASEPHNADAHHLLGMATLVQGQVPRAVSHFEQAVRQNEQSAVYRHHLGVALSAAGRKAEAIEMLRKALAIEPHSAAIHNDLAGVLRDMHQLAEAEVCFREAIRLDPRLVEAHNNLGSLLLTKGDWAGANEALQSAVRLRPDAVEIRFNLGNCYQGQGQYSEAAAEYRRALELQPHLAAAHYQLGSALFLQQRADDALASFREALRLDPQMIDAEIGLGATLGALQRFPEAERHLRNALQRRPNDLMVLYNLGATLFAQREFVEAAGYLSTVLQQRPNDAELAFRVGLCLQFEGRFEEAIAFHDRAIAGSPDNAEYHYYRAATWLTSGRFEPGWNEYEWRLKTTAAGQAYPQRRWKGEDIRGQKIVVYSEWGFGDTLHFIRYVPLLRERGADVFLAVQPGLIPLLEESGYKQLVEARVDWCPQCQWQVPLLSLAGIFQTNPETIPADIPYLKAKPGRVERWRDRLGGHEGLTVGIHWHGRNYSQLDARSIPLAVFEPLARVPGVRLISLQKNDEHNQISQLEGRFEVVDLGDEVDVDGSFLDTAAIMKNLDLVITNDTSIGHVAGALGVKVWVVLPRASEWRWMWDREDTPWYPTMRLFRQRRSNDWAEVLGRVAEELARFERGASA